jgi:hypothetical protein
MPVSVAQVAVELARPAPDSPVSEQWESWIARAYRLIEARLGSVTYAALDPDVLDDVVLTAVAEHVRAWRDSTASQYTVSVDDGTVSRKFERASGFFEIPDDLWPLLGAPAAGESFTIEP